MASRPSALVRALAASLSVTVLLALAAPATTVANLASPSAACQPATSVAAIIDDSGSMAGSDPIAIRRRAVELLVTKPSTADLTLGAVEFGGDAGSLFSPGPLAVETERQRMLASLSGLDDDGWEGDGGSTNYAAAFAVSGFDQPDADARIFLTDGGHNEGPYADDHRGGPPTYVIGLDIGPAGSSEEAALAARIAQETGGRYFPLGGRGATSGSELNRLQPTINRIDALLDCQALRKQTRQTFRRPGQVGGWTTTSFGRADALEIVVSWSVGGCDIGLRGAVVTNRDGTVVADLVGKRRIAGSRRRRAKLSVNTVAGKTFETITVQKPKHGAKLSIRLGARQVAEPALVRIQVRAVPPGAPPGESQVDTPTEGAATTTTPPEVAPAPSPAPAPAPAPLRRAITVYNKVTNGPTQMREDPVPARLTTQPWKFCSSRGCNINGTERVTGGTYDAAVCQTTGDLTTNGHNTDPSDDGNPNLYTSDRYYGVRLTDGTFGYVSWVWIDAARRGGLGLPSC